MPLPSSLFVNRKRISETVLENVTARRSAYSQKREEGWAFEQS